MLEDKSRNEKKMKSIRVNVTNILQYNLLSQLNEKKKCIVFSPEECLNFFVQETDSLRKIKRQLFSNFFFTFNFIVHIKTFYHEIQVLKDNHGGNFSIITIHC